MRTRSLVLSMITLCGGGGGSRTSSSRFIGTARGFTFSVDSGVGGTVVEFGRRSPRCLVVRVPPWLGRPSSASFERAAPRSANLRRFVTLPASSSSRSRSLRASMQDSSSVSSSATATATAVAPPIADSPELQDRAAASAAPAVEPKKEIGVMSDDDRYLFDLNGFLVVRSVLTPDEVKRANLAIDRHQHEIVERADPGLRNAKSGTRLYGAGPGRKDLGRMLEWQDGDAHVFRSVLAHERLVPIFHGLLGRGYRMDHLPLVIAQDCGAEGFQLHGGTIDCQSGEYNHHLAYSCVHGTIRTHLLGCNVMLTDHHAGDGGFCVVPGSHKSNFKMPKGMVDGERFREYVVQPETRAGDVVLFSEGTVHGALPWTPANRQRRVCLYRFAPATMAYGRSYFAEGSAVEGDGGTTTTTTTTTRWPSAMYPGLTDAQRAVLEPPYATRLDRPLIVDAATGAVQTSGRSERKKRHDAQVFGTPYF